MMHKSNNELVLAFPESVREDVLAMLSVFPENTHSSGSFSVKIAGEVLTLPNRIYHDPKLVDTQRLTSTQRELAYALLTRHNNGFVRQEFVSRIIGSSQVWIPPFIVKLMGEYVIEILHLIEARLSSLDKPIYRGFAKGNTEFLAITQKRIVSYWNCYYSHVPADEYVGFRLRSYLDSLGAEPTIKNEYQMRDTER
jgi:hypothetical protein